MVCREKTKENAIPSVYTKTPHLFTLWIKLFGVKRWVQGILQKEIGLPFCFLLNVGWQLFVALLKLSGKDYAHTRCYFERRPLREWTFLVLPAL